MTTPTIPLAILCGIRGAGGITGVQIIGAPVSVDTDTWAIAVRLDMGPVASIAAEVPRLSDWFAILDSAYPLGAISVFPSKENSIVATYPHQELNTPGPRDRPWRNGKICLDTPVRRLGLISAGPEPVGERDERLIWHLSRAVTWVQAAAEGTLLRPDDPFEIPRYPSGGDFRVVHDESPEFLQCWPVAPNGDWGFVLWDGVRGIPKSILALAFSKRDGTLIRKTCHYDEAKHGKENAKRWMGIWWMWPAPVVLSPWQAPLTWGDLRRGGGHVGVDVDKTLREISPHIRGKDAGILFLGYPIPRYQGQAPEEIHWQAVSLPKLESGGSAPHGFRPNEQGWWQRDRNGVFASDKPLVYMPTSNWHPDRLQARGRLSEPLRNARVAIVGCGALGSVVAELLVRGGVADIVLIDHDELLAGNLVRHTLSGHEIGKNKATALAERLGSVAPFASARAVPHRFPTVRTDVEALLNDRNLVVDCTACDEVLFALALGWWNLSKLFVSVSVGYRARRTFVFAHRGHSFPRDEFVEVLESFLVQERAQWAEEGETLEGAGCHSPLFPARMDDVHLAAVACIKSVEKLMAENTVDRRLVVFEQTFEGGFIGLRRVDLCNTVESS